MILSIALLKNLFHEEFLKFIIFVKNNNSLNVFMLFDVDVRSSVTAELNCALAIISIPFIVNQLTTFHLLKLLPNLKI